MSVPETIFTTDSETSMKTTRSNVLERTMKRWCFVGALWALVGALPFPRSPAAAAVLDVPTDFATIQAALDAASDGDTVLVAAGEYVIDTPIDPNRFHDSEDSQTPDVKNIVLRSLLGHELTTIRFSATPADPDRASVFIFENGEGPTSAVEGFTVTAGQGTVVGNERVGGGFLIRNGASPRLKDCVVQNNLLYEVWDQDPCWPLVPSFGGGLFVDAARPELTGLRVVGNRATEGAGLVVRDASPTLVDCEFNSNEGYYGTSDCGYGGYGGGGYFLNSTVTLDRCQFVENDAGSAGGLMLRDCTATLTECTISRNTCATYGGGLVTSGESVFRNCRVVNNYVSPYNFGGAGGVSAIGGTFIDCEIRSNRGEYAGGISCRDTHLTGCVIADNYADRSGGGIDCHDAVLEACYISGNFAEYWGGGVKSQGATTFTNCVITKNQVVDDVERGGSGVCASDSPRFFNCTISQNSFLPEGSPIRAEVVFLPSSTPVMTNCIVWPDVVLSDPLASPAITFSIISGQTLWPGNRNTNLDPAFVSVDDLRPQDSSPALNNGTAVDAPATDILGNSRGCDGAVDIGAYDSAGKCQKRLSFEDGTLPTASSDNEVPVLIDTSIPLSGYTVGMAYDASKITVTQVINAGTASADAEFFGGVVDAEQGRVGIAAVFNLQGDFSAQRLPPGSGQVAALLLVDVLAEEDTETEIGFQDVTVGADSHQPFTNLFVGVGGEEITPDLVGGVLSLRAPRATQLPGDCNQDQTIDISDPVCVLLHLFLDRSRELACGDNFDDHPGNVALMDWNGDLSVDLSDALGPLSSIFSGGPPHVLGEVCVAIEGCPELCTE
jgi:hypothetical protein